MSEYFFLSSADWGEPWGLRKCEYIASYIGKQTRQTLFYVKIFPSLSWEIDKEKKSKNKLLLGTISDEWNLKDIGKDGFAVDIYIVKTELKDKDVNVKDLIRVGTGQIFKTYHEADSSSKAYT